MPVNSERKDYQDTKDAWQRLRDCFAGRDAVIKAGAKYCPDLPGASVQTAVNVVLTMNPNEVYRRRGNFYNATRRTAEGLAGFIFQVAPEVEFPQDDYLADITLSHQPFEQFATAVGQEVVLLGRHGVLVDMPATADPKDARPYACSYKAEDIINWQSERVDGRERLTLLVLKEDAEVPKEGDPFVVECQPRYRSIHCDALSGGVAIVQLWKEDPRHKGQFVEDGPAIPLTRRGKALNFIPFVFFGATFLTSDVEKPPLLDLADVNLAHWRNSVDHEYGLHLVALPTPWVAGHKGSSDGALPMGPSKVWELDVNGSAGMLEFAGTGLGAIVVAMDEKKAQMAVLGGRILEGQSSQERETATSVKMRHSGDHASLRTIAQALEQGLTQVLKVMAWWDSPTIATPDDANASVELNKEYANVKASAQEVQVALTALQAGEISFETWWAMLSTGGWGREGVDAAAERKAIGEDKARSPEPPVDPELSPVDPAESKPAVPVAPAAPGN